MKPLLRTYLLECPDPRVFDRYQLRARVFAEHKNRAVMVCGRDPPDAKWVVRSMDGDQLRYVIDWIRRTPFAELHEEHVRLGPTITPKKQADAVKAYERARAARVKAEEAENEAAREAIRMNGRAYIVIDGIEHDPYYWEREGKTFMGYRARRREVPKRKKKP